MTCFLVCNFNASGQQKTRKQEQVKNQQTEVGDRRFWLEQMDKMARPVLENLANDQLKEKMPQMLSIRIDKKDKRIKVSYLEILGRTLSGIAPWLQLESGDEAELTLRKQYRQWVLKGLDHALDSTSKDFIPFDIADQQLVDASYLSLAFIRAPWLWENIGANNQKKLVASIITTRKYKPAFKNWLLFSAMNEAFLCRFGYEWDAMRVDLTLRQLEQWYVGDGFYMDGPSFAQDYYNSFVMHPFLAAITEIVAAKSPGYADMLAKIKARNQRYAVIQERTINADGSYPVIGRSATYRGACFHHLADMAFKKRLPGVITPAQVRCALTAVIKKTLESPTTYNDGWLTIGVYGAQPDIADSYNNQGSPYLASNIFLPLGLDATDEFWSAPPASWTAKKLWSGEDVHMDHHQSLK
ncbi:MAG TPA: DUF2264 domain-containing protein [Phnomibacter sp.]|nr:DUF2264 domain-containing protein [Phnomibacter sp.]